jgi:hypothetical protein
MTSIAQRICLSESRHAKEAIVSSGEVHMFRKVLLSAMVAGFLFAIGGGTASAQDIDYNNWTRHNHGAAPDVDKWGIPCPTGGCQQAIDQMKRHRKHRHVEDSNGGSVPQTQEQNDAGYVGGRPFFSNNANDQPK